MKDFIEKLKKHGYEVTPEEHGTWVITTKAVQQYVIVKKHGREQPDLLVWCLDEIERLGWFWGMNIHATHGVREFEVTGINDKFVKILHNGQTKTEACCNALLAVLEASRQAILDKSGAERC